MARDKFFDSIKFILVFIVVFAHLVEINKENHINLLIYGYLASFVMPLFIFISGYFSKGITWKKFRAGFISLIATFFLFQTIFSIPAFRDGSFNFIDFLITPKSILWYIMGLLIWRFILCLIKDRFSSGWIISVSFIISLALGFYTKEIHPSRILVFFPFFLLGYYCPREVIERIRGINKIYTIVISIIFLIYLNYTIDIDYYLSLFAERPYVGFSSISSGFIYRIAMFVFAIIIGTCVINLAPNTFYKLGNTTMIIYLIHSTVIHILRENIPNILDYNIIIIFMISVAICALLAFLNRFKVVQYLIDPASILGLFKKKKV